MQNSNNIFIENNTIVDSPEIIYIYPNVPAITGIVSVSSQFKACYNSIYGTMKAFDITNADDQTLIQFNMFYKNSESETAIDFAIYLSYASIRIDWNQIDGASDTGIYCTNSSNPYIENNTITNNQNGIVCLSLSSPIIAYNNITGNLQYGVNNTDSSVIVNAQYNWWGAIFGPTHPSNQFGAGDRVSDYVDYDPWLTLPYP